MYFKMLELCINFYLKHEIFFNVFQNSLRFYDPFLRSEFVLYFPCRVKIVILTTLVIPFKEQKIKHG
jgi:hypothetical protein